MILEWNRKHTVGLIIIGLVLAVIVFITYYQFITPMKNEVSQLKDEVVSQKRLIESTDHEESVLIEAQNRFDQLSEQLPNAIYIDQLLLTIESIEGASNVTLTEMNTSEERTLSEEYPNVASLSYQITFESSGYQEMNQFVTGLSNTTQLIEINHLEYTQNDNNSRIEGIVTITVFYDPENG